MELRGGGDGGVGSGVAEAAPGQAQGPEENEGPEEQGKAEFKENAEDECQRGENGGDAFDERVSEGKGGTGKIRLKRSAIVFHQNETDVGLRDSRKQVFVLALGFGRDFIGLGNVFFESDGVAKLALSFALEFLETREIGLRGGEMTFRSGKFDGGIFAGFGDVFDAA